VYVSSVSDLPYDSTDIGYAAKIDKLSILGYIATFIDCHGGD